MQTSKRRILIGTVTLGAVVAAGGAASAAAGSATVSRPAHATAAAHLAARTLWAQSARTVLTPEQFGAVGDGVTDDSAALQAALNASGPNTRLLLAAGKVYAHSAVLTVGQAGTRIIGSGTLLATAEATSAVVIDAPNVSITGPTFHTASTTIRWGTPAQMGVVVQNTTGTSLQYITVNGSAAAGIFVEGSSNFTIGHDLVENTRADGIHMTGGSYDGHVNDNTTRNTGDDGISVVSYLGDGAIVHDITETGNNVIDSAARGVSVVGGTDIAISDFQVEASAAAGLYIAAEGAPYYTYAPVNVTATGGTITDANTNTTIDHGAVLVVSAETSQQPANIAVTGMAISATRPTASRDAGVITYGVDPTAVALDNFAITGGPTSAYEGNTPTTAYSTSGWTQNGVPLPGS